MALSLSPQEIVRRDKYPLLRIAPSWERVRLGDIANVQNGFPFKSNLFSTESGFPLIRIRDVGRGETLHFYTGEYDDEFVVKRGDILIGMDGDFRAARWKGPDALLNQRVCRLTVESEHYDEDFFLTCLQPYLNAVNAETSSVTVKHLSSKTVQDIPLPLPPLNEQRRIVEKIEAQFDEIDKGVESLHTARTTLGLYRQSLLKSAFEGRLTADWRAQNADKLEAPETLLARIQSERDARYKAALDDWQDALATWRADGEKGKKPAKPKRPNTYPNDLTDLQIALPELPFGWRWAHLGWCSSGPAYGTSAKSNNTGEVPVIRMGNLQSGLIDWDNLAYTSDADEIEQYSLKPGDVLFNRTNSPELVGKTSIYKGERPALFAGYLVRVNQIEEIASGPYVTYFLNSPFAIEHGKTVKTDGVNQSNINASKLQEYPFPFCPTAEQAEIVQLLDTRLDAAARLEAEIDAALTRADALRQSILKKAFSGQLVPQDADDEPASVLLERIKVEKAERERDVKRDRKLVPTLPPKTRRPTLTDLIEVLEKQKTWISASKAAQELNISDGASSDDVEAFYRQLKEYVEGGEIEVERRGDEDWLRLVKAEVA